MPALPDELFSMAGQLAGSIVSMVHMAKAEGTAEGLELAAQYIDATITEAGIIGDALAILLIIRDQLRLMATHTSTSLTEDDDAPSSRPDDVRPEP